LQQPSRGKESCEEVYLFIIQHMRVNHKEQIGKCVKFSAVFHNNILIIQMMEDGGIYRIIIEICAEL